MESIKNNLIKKRDAFIVEQKEATQKRTQAQMVANTWTKRLDEINGSLKVLNELINEEEEDGK